MAFPLYSPLSFRSSEDDPRYWLADPTPSLGPLYPHNTYHGAPTASGAKQAHPRAPLLLNHLEFKPIRFTEEYTSSQSSSKSQQQQRRGGGRARQHSSNEGSAGGDDQVGRKEQEGYGRSDLRRLQGPAEEWLGEYQNEPGGDFTQSRDHSLAGSFID